MKEFSFQIKINGEARTANLRFATKVKLQRYHQNLSTFATKSSRAVREAVEFTRLAAKRWRYYSRIDEAAESFAGLSRKIQTETKCEVAFIMVASISQNGRDLPVGLAYCRRTWCHHLALDFLALHPRALDPTWRMSGIGSGIVFGLVQLARALNIRRISGEATANSAPFYEKLLAVSAVQDLFTIETSEMAVITKRQEKISKSALATTGGVRLH
jgi:hypothetical protein